MVMDEVTKIEEEHKRLKMCFGACSLNCWSGYRTSKRAVKVTTQVKELLNEEGKMVMTRVVFPLWPKSDSALSLQTQEVFLREAIECMRDVTVDMIGIWGMGGVGKTSLMKRINNHPYVESAGYDVVIWVVVSQEVSFDRLQRDIAVRVGLEFTEEQGMSIESQAETLRHYLKKEKFLLLLDDIWKAFDLDMLGIPHLDSSHNSKVVFTTRSEMVCDQMAAFSCQARLKKIKVECLRPEEAWELFLANTGETVQSIIRSERRVSERAQTVANKCAGLPLALVVIARAMSSNKTWREWEDAVHSINDLRLQELWSQETDPLYPVLRVSYDRLMNDQMRKCFLCCALWPEDFNIPKEDLIRCWLGMGLIADFHNIVDAFNKGHTIIERLKGAAMLEESEIELEFKEYLTTRVKLHDIIRGMALWIAYDHEKWIVRTQAEINRATTLEEERSRKWREAEVVSLMFGKVEGLSSQFPRCPNIKALLLRETEIIGDVDAHAFLQNIPVLQYLNLSGNKEHVFNEDKLLCDMSHQLVGLQCLDLSHVFDLVLPKELVNLSKLKHLFIRHGGILSIPRGLISGLEKLEILDLSNTAYSKWETPGEARIEELGCANAAGGLKGIGLSLLHDHFKILPTYIDRHLALFELGINGDMDTLPTLELSKALFPGGIFPCTLRSLQFHGFYVDAVVISAEENDRLDNLEVLDFRFIIFWRHGHFRWEGGAMPQVLFQNVSSLTFFACPGLADIGWIAQLPYLEILIIESCNDLEQVIRGKKAGREVEEDETEEGEKVDDKMILPKLRFLKLNMLSSLRSFSDPTNTFPSLQHVLIKECPNLDLSFLEKTKALTKL